MGKLGEDLIKSEIMVRLPVKSLLRFRCVSKPWCALIDSKDFEKKHLNHSCEMQTTDGLILEGSFDPYTVGLNSLTEEALKLVLPKHPARVVAMLMGSCNGLLCFMYPEPIVIWNPATKKHVKVWKPSLVNQKGNDGHNPQNCHLVHGFGYDNVSDDYKVVIMTQYTPFEVYSFRTETKLYSLKSNFWKVIQDFPDYIIGDQQIGALVCGALHWIGVKRKPEIGSTNRLLVAFNLVTEKHMTVMLPDVFHDQVPMMLVSELGGCLSIVCKDLKVGALDLWVMKNYAVKESWTKLLTLSSPEIIRIVKRVIPLVYSKSGDEVLLMLNSEKLLWYNTEKRTFKFVHVRGAPMFTYAAIYQESLVSLGERVETDEKQGGENDGAKEDQKEKSENPDALFPYSDFTFLITSMASGCNLAFDRRKRLKTSPGSLLLLSGFVGTTSEGCIDYGRQFLSVGFKLKL